MKINIEEFISNVPILRILGRNLALNAGIAFVIQDFLIPLYSNYIFEIVSGLMVFGILALVYWYSINKKKEDKNVAHVSFQASLICIILAIMVSALSSVSKALSSDDRGILASNVDFVANLQDNTNVYDEGLKSLGRDISKVSSQFTELQSDLSTLSAQISTQLSEDGTSLNNEEFLDKISTLIEEKNLNVTSNTIINEDDTEEVKELRKNLDIATELLRQVTLANVNLQQKESVSDIVNLNADSIVYYIGELKTDINDLRNFSLQLLANTALADTRSELNLFKSETKKDLEDFKLFTSKEIDEIKQLANKILDMDSKGSNRGNNNLSRELKDLSKAMEKSNTNAPSIDESYLEEIVQTYQELADKIDNSSVQTDIKEIKQEIANLSSTQSPNADQSDLIARIQASSNDGSIDNSAGLSELKYYIVELMKDQNEIRQIVRELRELLEKNSDN